MTFVIGRETADERPTARLGAYRALDGSSGASLALDVDGPHAVLVVGKRGYGKSHTLGVVAESLARCRSIAPVVADPMGEFASLAAESDGEAVPATVVDEPRVRADALGARSWCDMLDLSPESAAGSLVWAAAGAAGTLDAMLAHVEASDASDDDRRAASNHLELAASWDVFDSAGLDAATLAGPAATVLDLSGLTAAPMNAVVRGVAAALYRARVDERIDRLPWLLVDEAHAFFDGVAGPALERILTRGRTPGVSLVLATQRPSAVPAVGISQSDLLLAHRLTAGADLDALERARPTYVDGTLERRMPTEPGDVFVVDDATETVHVATVRERLTPHEGDSPAASEVGATE